MKINEITESNYQDYQNLDIVAFSFAFGGTMGEGGGIYIIDRAGQIYHANYCRGNDCINTAHIGDIIPIFDNIMFGPFSNKSNNDNWVSIHLGCGNHLVIASELNKEFKKKVEAANYEYYGELFRDWPGYILSLLGVGDSKLTMGKIWEVADLG